MNKFYIEKCPNCGCNEFGKGFQAGYGMVHACNRLFKASKIYHIICTNCGCIIYSYVQKPENFKL